MTTPKKKSTATKKPTSPGSQWSQVAKEIGAAVALAVLPIIMNSIAESLLKKSQEQERNAAGGRA